MSNKIKAAIIGPGNIGMDLMFKLMRSKYIDVDTVVGIIPESEGLALARKHGKKTSAEGIKAILGNKDIKIVFDATSAKAHLKHAPLLEQDGKIAIDLTPAAVGPYCVPAVTMEEQLNCKNVNMVTCAGQATTPIVYAINKIADVKYAEIVATISSRSAGPGTRQNIDEFTETTAKALEKIGGADKGKAIIILNPAEPPIMMRNTIYTRVANPDAPGIIEAIEEMVGKIKKYVPGYRLKVPPIIDGDKITTIIEVEGEGAYLPKYAGNLDIITAAAVAFADEVAKKLLAEEQAKEVRAHG
ncbi:acetaldehyde dehydrogenase (acetylating) [Carboxydothermus hydrogenoformans]|uniref:Acetaldehyde dehydrogenase n=1 Tax=Carboxydothermus hydrogenoformans (strain ATCC BAA-161 / DSM 6008 / Z-2901) TaxID=246194 RepID=ACDH_CARHZ|nr:acetaldehyde dehydrogenase (acetylating) [Carboxydothermus hydrogenoformans]Q3ACM1.1 RecName: Full=Acetaldehyde dehydrogenase; AltName: Full=Acetaldehyde dehydrogenase [acetylating] [Carboxydothermus hydrogenoformans Z-2901]ABB13885.1 acetaldehyde dehydrogenase [Carboxydothermus hydrogenoformans Z-2901]